MQPVDPLAPKAIPRVFAPALTPQGESCRGRRQNVQVFGIAAACAHELDAQKARWRAANGSETGSNSGSGARPENAAFHRGRLNKTMRTIG
jgi:hypothetical protein